MTKYKKFIKKGIVESLDNIPFHGKAPIKRLLMLGKSMIPKSDTHIAVHFVNTSTNLPKYSELHKHNHDEINLILSEESNLIYEIQLDDEVYQVTSPATIFVPKGIKHSAHAISGKGIFVCIILSDEHTSE